MKPCFSVTGNKANREPLCLTRNKNWFQHSSSVLKSNQLSILPALPFLFLSCWTDNFYSIHREADRWNSSWAAAGIWLPVACCWWLRTSLHSGVHPWRTLELRSTKRSLFYCNCPNSTREGKKVRRTLSIAHYFQNVDSHVSLLDNQKLLHYLWMVTQERKDIENPLQPQVSK